MSNFVLFTSYTETPVYIFAFVVLCTFQCQQQSLAQLVENTDETFVIDNEALYDICFRCI